MSRKTTKRGLKKIRKGTKKQHVYKMVGCSKKNKTSCKNKKIFSSSLSNKSCPKCGPNCHCGPNCKCPHPCPGTCYLNRRLKKQRGGQGCGSTGCPLSPLSWNKMNKFGGKSDSSYPNVLTQPVIESTKRDYSSILGIGQNGGSFYKPAAPMPGPFTGSAWGADFKWPGVNGIAGDKNYLASYAGSISNDPQQQMLPADSNAGYLTKNSMVGGYVYDNKNDKRVKKKHKKYDSKTYSKSDSSSSKSLQKGGGLVPQDLVNLGRDFSYNFKTAYNAINGYNPPVDPLPYKGQLTGAFVNSRFL